MQNKTINLSLESEEVLIFFLGTLVAFSNVDMDEDYKSALKIIRLIKNHYVRPYKDIDDIDFSILSRKERLVIIDAVSYCVEEWDMLTNNFELVNKENVVEITEKLIRPIDDEVATNIIGYIE